MALSDYQFEYKILFTGGSSTTLTFGAGTVIDVMELEGLFDQDSRDGDRPFTRFHGDVQGEHTVAPKYINLSLAVRGDPGLQTYWDDVYKVQEVFLTRPQPNDEEKLKFKVPGLPERFIRARTVSRRFARSAQTEWGWAPIQAQLKAADPRIYAPTGGMNTSGAQSGTFSVTNAGIANAYPKLTFSSTGSTITLTNNTYTQTLTIVTPPAGTLIADMDIYIRGVPGLVMYIGSTNHYTKWQQPRLPFVLGKGSNSLTLTGATDVTVQWYDTWL
jgi:hypothetical protein